MKSLKLNIPFEQWWALAERPFRDLTHAGLAQEIRVASATALLILGRAQELNPETPTLDNLLLMQEVGVLSPRVANRLADLASREEEMLGRTDNTKLGLKDIAHDLLQEKDWTVSSDSVGLGNQAILQLRAIYNTLGLANDSLRTIKKSEQFLGDRRLATRLLLNERKLFGPQHPLDVVASVLFGLPKPPDQSTYQRAWHFLSRRLPRLSVNRLLERPLGQRRPPRTRNPRQG